MLPFLVKTIELSTPFKASSISEPLIDIGTLYFGYTYSCAFFALIAASISSAEFFEICTSSTFSSSSVGCLRLSFISSAVFS